MDSAACPRLTPITPFHNDLSLDLDALARNVDEMSRYPFCALVAAGGTGELYSLTVAESAPKTANSSAWDNLVGNSACWP